MTIPLRHRLSQFSNQVALYASAFAVVLCAGGLAILQGFELRPLEVHDYGVIRCATGGSEDNPPLRILDAVYVEELDLLEFWCSTSHLDEYFVSIRARSVHRDRVDLRDLYEERYDLVLAKQELMETAVSSGRQGITYRKVASYPDYGSQLVSLKGTPELSSAWLAGKRLGMVDDPNSVSGYQIPLAALKNRGLESVPDIIYYRSYRQLYRALFSGEVDVIPALLSEEGPTSALQLPPGLVLEETLPGPAWYISEDLTDSAARCALQRVLEELSASARIHYFRALTVTRSCPDE